MAATVWKVQVEAGQRVEQDTELIILESMKMEIPVEAPRAGAVKEIRVEEGQTVQEGDVVAILE